MPTREPINQLGRLVPGFAAAPLRQQIQPTSNSTDVVGVIKAVIDAQQKARAHYKEIIKATDGKTMERKTFCIRPLADEEEHLVLFNGSSKNTKERRPQGT